MVVFNDHDADRLRHARLSHEDLSLSGNCTRTSAPPPGEERTSIWPPTEETRSSMLSKPKLSPCDTRFRASSTSNPVPSSRTIICKAVSEQRSCMERHLALACFNALVRAS